MVLCGSQLMCCFDLAGHCSENGMAVFHFALRKHLHNAMKEIQAPLLIVVEHKLMTKLIELKRSVVLQNHGPQLRNKLYFTK